MSENKTLAVNLVMKDGNLKQQTKTIANEIKNVESEFKKASAGVKDFEKTQDGLNAKLKAQQQVLELTKTKLEAYKKKQEECTQVLDKTVESYKKQEEKVKSLKQQLESAETTYGKTSDEVKELKTQLEQAEKAFEKKKTAVINANNSLTNINTTINKTEGECNKLESEIEELNSELDNIDSGNVDGLANSFDDAGQKALDFGAKMTIVGAGVKEVGEGMKNAGKEVVDTLADMVEKGAEYQVEQGAITTMLGDQEGAVRSWADTQAESLGMTEQQLTQVTAKNMMLAEKMGLSGDEAREMAQGISVATQDLATFYDVPAEEMQQKFNSALNGSTEIMDQYGVDISVASLEQSNYVQSLGKTWKEMTEAEKKQARYNKILEDTAKVQGNANKESEGFGVQTQLLKTNIGEMVKTLGEKLIPVLEPVVKTIGDVVNKLKAWVEENPKLATAIMIIVGAVGGILAVLGSLLVPIGSLIIMFGALSTAIGSAGGIMAFFSASVLPILAVIGGLIAIVVILYNAIKSNFDGIKSAVTNMIETCSPAFESFKEAFSRLWDTFQSIYETVIQPLFHGIGVVIQYLIEFATPLFKLLFETFATCFNVISDVWDNIGKPVFDWIISVIEGLAPVFMPIFTALKDIFSNACSTISSIWNGILYPVFKILIETIGWIGEKVSPVFTVFKDIIVDAMKAVLSPIQWVIDKLSDLFGWLSSVGEKVGGVLNKLNPFKSFSMNETLNVKTATPRLLNEDISTYSRMGMPMPLDVALSGSYYNADTINSRAIQPFVQMANNIPSVNSSFNTSGANNVNLNKLIDKFTNEITNMKQDNKSMMSMLSTALNSMADAINNINLKDKIVVEGSVTVDNKIDGRQLSKVMAPYAAKANAKYEKNNLR